MSERSVSRHTKTASVSETSPVDASGLAYGASPSATPVQPNRYRAAQRGVYALLEEGRRGRRPARVFSAFLIALIVLNVIAVVLESVDEIHTAARGLFHWFEVFSVGVFTLEYALRLWACTSMPDYRAPLRGRLRFAVTPLAIVDVLAILPFYVPLMASLDLRALRALRLMRLLRLFKVARYSESLRIIRAVLDRKRHELLVTLFSVLVLLVVAATLIYAAERDTQPDKFGSIPASMWWAVATLTTIGYGDVYPVTVAGKALGAAIALLGVGLFALPTGILAAGFMEELNRGKERKVCPHCGRPIAD